MKLTLAKDVEEFLAEQVHSGACSDANEFVNDVLRSVQQQQRMPFTVTPELEAWLLEAADKPATLLEQEDFNTIRERVRKRLGAKDA